MDSYKHNESAVTFPQTITGIFLVFESTEEGYAFFAGFVIVKSADIQTVNSLTLTA